MPTASKLVAAILLGALAYVVTEMVKLRMPERTEFGLLTPVNVAIGMACGWFVIGNRVGDGLSAAISNGFTGTAALLFWGLFVQSVNEMVKLSMRHHYDGMVEAMAAVFEIAIDLAQYLNDPVIIVTILLGGIGVGVISEIASRHWR